MSDGGDSVKTQSIDQSILETKACDSEIVHPDWYRANTGHEAIDVIHAWGLNFCLGNALKYICRAGAKPGQSTLKDLKKSVNYLEMEIARIEKESK